jgi:hypothetical protein
MEIAPTSPIVRVPSRAVQYVRMSTEHQQYLPQNQLDMIRQYAADHNMDIVREYSDHGRSGLNIAGRDGPNQLMSDVEAKRTNFTSLHYHLSDQNLLERLKELLRLRGLLSGLLVDEADDMPSSSYYLTRFGSLTRAYTLIGWMPDRDFAYIEINRDLRRRHADLISAILDELLALGATVSVDPAMTS